MNWSNALKNTGIGVFSLCLCASSVYADREGLSVSAGGLKKLNNVVNIFGEKLPSQPVPEGETVELTNVPKPDSKPQKQDMLSRARRYLKDQAFVGDAPGSHLVSPDKRIQVRINPDAPGSFVGLALCANNDDMECAKSYARQHVRYLQDLIYRMNQVVRLIIEARVEEEQMSEDEAVLMPQFMEQMMRVLRSQPGYTGAVATHEASLRQIVPDPKGQVEIFFLFSMSNKFALDMASDIERLNYIVRRDPNAKISALVVGDYEKEWLKLFAKESGLTIPIKDGNEFARQMKISYLPSTLFFSPTNQKFYLRSGQDSFRHIYEIFRTVQGLSLDFDSNSYLQQLQKASIGSRELAANEKKGIRVVRTQSNAGRNTSIGTF